jgi:hypothetical protein
MEEKAKAVQEVAKTTGKFIEAAEKAGGFVSKVVGGASTQLGGILEDWTRYFRYANLLKIADKVEAIHAGRRIEGKSIPIPLKTAIPMLEAASLEDNDTLQEVWARLIVNGMDPTFQESTHPGYVEVITQLSSDEAIILSELRKRETYPVLYVNDIEDRHGDTRASIAMEASFEWIREEYMAFCKDLSLKRPLDARMYLDNLQRLQIVEFHSDFSVRYGAALPSPVNSTDRLMSKKAERLEVTEFGKGFIAACITERKRRSP